MTATVDALSGEVGALQEFWPLTEALMGGTPEMRKKGTTLLPRWPNEDLETHKARLATATLFPAFRRTVMVMAGKPFAKPLTLDDKAPPEIQEWADDIDREGVNLHTFASEMMVEALAHGMGGILVESPRADGSAVQTRAEQRSAGVRPYFVRVMHSQLLGWRVEVVNGARKLMQLRIREDVTVPDGDFGEKVEKRVRVLEPGRWAVWKKAADKDEWSIDDEGVSGLDYIPFVPLYGFRKGFMCGTTPLLDLAYMNVQHWQDSSDQAKSVRFARVRTMAIIGATSEQPIVAGADYILSLPAGADIKIAQGSAESVKVGRDELAALEEQMIQAGAELLVKKPGQRTATESKNDAEANKSDLQRIVEGFEDALNAALSMMCDYAGLSDENVSVQLFKDFGVTSMSEASGQLVIAMRDAGLISDETAIAELKRRGELSDEVDAEEERQSIIDGMPGEDHTQDASSALPPDPANDQQQQDVAA